MRPRILIADDEEGVRESLNLILGDLYDTVFAVNGEEALTKITQEPFDLVMMDIKMPRLDGLDVLKQLKTHRGPLPPILILSAYQSVEVAKEAVKLGARDYIPKPFERDHILSTVQSILPPAR